MTLDQSHQCGRCQLRGRPAGYQSCAPRRPDGAWV